MENRLRCRGEGREGEQLHTAGQAHSKASGHRASAGITLRTTSRKNIDDRTKPRAGRNASAVVMAKRHAEDMASDNIQRRNTEAKDPGGMASRTTLCKSCGQRVKACLCISNVCSFTPSCCKRTLFLFVLHMIAHCLRITDDCVNRVHACIVFALRRSV